MAAKAKKDGQTRETLLLAARGLIAEDPNFSLKTLLANTGLSRAAFRRSFASKEELLAALTGEEVKGLGEILEVAQSAVKTVAQPLRAAVGSDVAPTPVPPPPTTDAWLERRLRVFERALTGLEKRQEKAEQTWMQQMGLVGERLTELELFRTAPAPQNTVAAVAVEFAPVEIKQPAEARQPEVKPSEPMPAEAASTEKESAEMEIQSLTLSDQAFVERIASPEPVGEREIADFIAHARKVAQSAAPGPVSRRRRPNNLRWLAWCGALIATVLFCAGMLLASGAFGGPAGAQPVMTNSGVTHRHVAQKGVARLVALADSGDAGAQTALAMDYLKGNGVASNDDAARRWSMAAASQGQPLAEYLLGTLYLEGQRNESEAARWFLAAAAQGNVKAMHNLAIAYAQGSGVEKDPAEAVKWFMRAAEQGYRDSEFDLAVLYERGLGVPQSARAALKWYLIAAAQGDAPSAARATFLKNQMDAMETKQAVIEAASFMPRAPGSAANQAPAL